MLQAGKSKRTEKSTLTPEGLCLIDVSCELGQLPQEHLDAVLSEKHKIKQDYSGASYFDS